MKLINKFLYLLSSHEKRRAYLLLGMIITMAFIDMLGIASILPFIAILTNPQLIETNYILKSAFEFTSAFGVVTDQQFLFVLGIIVFVLLVISLLFKAITAYTQVRFVQMREYSIEFPFGKYPRQSGLYNLFSLFFNF